MFDIETIDAYLFIYLHKACNCVAFIHSNSDELPCHSPVSMHPTIQSFSLIHMFIYLYCYYHIQHDYIYWWWSHDQNYVRVCVRSWRFHSFIQTFIWTYNAHTHAYYYYYNIIIFEWDKQATIKMNWGIEWMQYSKEKRSCLNKASERERKSKNQLIVFM